MRNADLRLMLVTDPAMAGRRGLVDTVLAAVAGGVTIVQLRDKHASDDALADTGAILKAALAPTGVPLIVNDRADVAAAIGADGVHLGEHDGDPAVARRLLGPDALIGWSVTRLAQADTLPPGIDYVGVGPIFSTASKLDAAPPLGIAAIRALKPRMPVPMVAIGGLDARNAPAVIAAGARGIAVISAIASAIDPEGEAALLRQAVAAGAAR